MRIPAISNNFSVRKNNIEQKNPSFQKIRKDALLSEKISHVIPLSENGDIIVVGKSFESVMKGLKKTLGEFSDIIKRILHIKASIAVPMAISIDKDGEFQCVNLGEKTFALVKDMKSSNLPYKHFAIEPQNSMSIDQGDIIVNGKKEIELTDWLSSYASAFDGDFENLELTEDLCEIHDYTTVQQDKTEEVNRALVEKITQTEAVKEIASKPKKGISFDDIGGLDSTINRLKKGILYPIEFPYAYKDRKKTNKGFVLYGPPGTGKTLLAQALSNEVNAHYIKLNGLEMASKWVGESEKNWRELFATAKKNQPTIIFIDEFDAVGRSRNGADIHGDTVVNQILTLMDDIEKENQKVFVITATNKLEALDGAIIRSGRFGEQIEVSAPDRKGIEQIFEIHTRQKQLDKNFDKISFLDKCSSAKMTGADIAFIVDKAHEFSWERCGIYEKMERKALKEEDIINTFITQDDFLKALELWNRQHDKNTRKPIGYGK